MNVVKLAYYDEFQCAGAECGDSCCKNWHITLSRSEYLNYKNIECSSALRSAMDNAFRRKQDGNDPDYAEVKLDGEGKCPLLGGDNLCMIQNELGKDALCFTCSVFPRLHMKVGDDTVMMSCSPTCCRVNELLISRPEGLKIIEARYDGKDRYINRDLFTVPRLKSDRREFSYFWSILYTRIAILQNRRFTVPERMLILGYFCQKVDGFIKNNEMSKTAPLSEMLLNNELCEKIANSLKPEQSDERIAYNSVRILYKMYLHARSSSSAFVSRSFNRFMGKLAVKASQIGGDEPNISFSSDEYARLTEAFGKITEERPYIIENLLVNLVFSQSINDGVWVNYFTLAVFYNTMKLCVPIFLKDGYTDGDLAVAIAYAVKLVINTNLAKGNILLDSVLKKECDLPHAAFLIC